MCVCAKGRSETNFCRAGEKVDMNSDQANTYTVRPVIIGTSNNGALGFDEESPGAEESEEVILGKRWKRGLQKPSAEEVRRHMISHYPYRSWCEYCVRGKAEDSPRKQVFREEWESEPVYIWDYVYMKTKAATGSSDAEMQDATDLGSRHYHWKGSSCQVGNSTCCEA